MTALDPLAMMQASELVLKDSFKNKVGTNAIYIHASCVQDDELDGMLLDAAILLQVSFRVTSRIVINGATREKCLESNVAYPGYEGWLRQLQEKSVPEKEILVSPEALNTAAECDMLIDLAFEYGWESITLVSHPHHILRCMLQMVFCLKRRKLDRSIRVYAHSPEISDWSKPVKKPVKGRLPNEDGSLFDQILGEYGRIVKYMDPTGTGYTPHATLEELIEYMLARDAIPAA